MNAKDKDRSLPMPANELTPEQIRRHMLGLASDSEAVMFERQLASKPAVADAAKEVLPDSFIRTMKRIYKNLRKGSN